MYDYILFDFDGTLMDTSRGVFASFDKVVEHYKLDIDRRIYNTMIGPPLLESFSKTLHLPDSEIRNAIAVYREYYVAEGMYQADVYPGVVDLIKKLKADGKMICTATSKPEIYARAILERKGMLDLFDFAGGADTDEKSRVTKLDVVNYVLKTQNLEDKKDRCILIGDRHYDINGAHAAGIKCAGILWGFGDRKEFEENGADYILETPEEVYSWLKS